MTPADPENPTMKEVFGYLKEIDEKITLLSSEFTGSWQWDKTTGILTVVDSDGAPAMKFEVADNDKLSKRERRKDLE